MFATRSRLDEHVRNTSFTELPRELHGEECFCGIQCQFFQHRCIGQSTYCATFRSGKQTFCGIACVTSMISLRSEINGNIHDLFNSALREAFLRNRQNHFDEISQQRGTGPPTFFSLIRSEKRFCGIAGSISTRTTKPRKCSTVHYCARAGRMTSHDLFQNQQDKLQHTDIVDSTMWWTKVYVVT